MSWRTDKIKAAVAALKATAKSLHTAVADNGAGITDRHGLADMARPLGATVVPAGRPVDAIVGATQTIYPGDMVRWVSQVETTGDPLRLAVEGVKVLDAREMRVKRWYQGAVVAFTQDGYTKLKTVYRTYGSETLTLGPTLTLSEDEAVEVALGVYDDDFCFVVYTCDAGTHYYTKIAVLDGFNDTVVVGEDLFTAETLENMPRNLAISHKAEEQSPYRDENYAHGKAPRAVVSYTRGEGAYLNSVAYLDGGMVYGEEYTLKNMEDADYDAYYHAWGVAWGVDALYVTYPVKGSKTSSQGLKVLGCWNYGRPYIKAGEVMHFNDHPLNPVTSPFGYAIPVAEVYPCREWTHGTILAHGVTRLSDSGGKLKSSLVITTWAAGIVPEVQPDPPEYVEGEENRDINHYPSVVALSSAEADVAYGANIGLIRVSDYADDTTLVAYCHETTLYAMPIAWRDCGSLGGNAVAVGTFEEYGTVVAVPNFGALAIYQDGGAVYAKMLNLRSVVIPTDADHAEGVAVRGGSGGATIPVRKAD